MPLSNPAVAPTVDPTALIGTSGLYTNPDASPQNLLFVPRIGRRVRWDAALPLGSVRCGFVDVATQITTNGGAGITKSDDATIAEPILNASAVKLSTTGGGSSYGAKLATALATPVDVTGKVIQFWMRVESDLLTNMIANACNLQVSSDSFATANYHQVNLISSAEATAIFPSGRWHRFSFDISEFTAVGTGATLTAINNFRIVNSAAGGGGTANWYFPPFFDVCPRMSPKAKCVLWIDDGTPEQFTNFAYELAKYGFPGVVAWNLAQVGQTLAATFPQLKSLHDQHGWQVSAHSWTNSTHNSLITGDTWESSVVAKVRSLAAGDGWFGMDHFSYHGGVGVGVKAYTNAQYAQVRRLFLTARGYTNTLRTVETIPFGDPWNLRAWGTASGDTAAQWTAYVDKAIAAKGLAQFVWHTNTTGAELTKLQTLLAYLDANRASIDVVTIEGAVQELWKI